MSKYEQISNWNKRPLRKSQIHYGALDAYILLKIYEELKLLIAKTVTLYVTLFKAEREKT